MYKKKNKGFPAPVHHRKDWKLFPSFTYPQGEKEIKYISKPFIGIVKEAVRSLDFYDNEFFDDGNREFYRLAKQTGFEILRDELYANFSTTEARAMLSFHIGKIGTYIYEYIKRKNMFDFYFPYNEVGLIPPVGSNFAIYFKALLSIQPQGNSRVFYATDTPIISVGGRKHRLAFSKHAIERMCQRMSADSRTYTGIWHFENYFSDTSNYELVRTCERGFEALFLSFFQTCEKGSLLQGYLSVPSAIDPGAEYCYRAGYCPLELNDGFAVATTWLTPGMDGTPERVLLERSNMAYSEKMTLRRGKENISSFTNLHMTEDFTAVKWFHENGIPQVKTTSELVIPK